MTPATQQEVDRFWAEEMATTPESLSAGPPLSCTIQQIYDGVQFFQRDGRVIVASPPNTAERVTRTIRSIPRADVFSVDFVERLLSPEVDKILGPAHIAYADPSTFRSSDPSGCRILTVEDAPIYAAFRETLSAEELEQSGFNTNLAPAFGKFVDGKLAAAANYEVWASRIAHVTVATAPQFRRNGHAASAVSALAEHALGRNLILQYRALTENANSLKLAQALGFEHYCSTIYVRLQKR